MPWYLQAYLDLAKTRIEEQRKEAGRITNKELQKKVFVIKKEKLINHVFDIVFVDCSCFLLLMRCNFAIHCTVNNLLVL